MNTTQRNGIMQRWNTIQHDLTPELRNGVGALTPKLAQVAHILEWVRIGKFASSAWGDRGHPEHDRGMLASAFVAKYVRVRGDARVVSCLMFGILAPTANQLMRLPAWPRQDRQVKVVKGALAKVGAVAHGYNGAESMSSDG